MTITGEPAASDALLKVRTRRELIVKVAFTLLVLIGVGMVDYHIYYQTATALRKAMVSEQTQQELKAISLAAQKFHKEHNRWPRDMFELRNDPKAPFVPRRDRWARGYVYAPPKEGAIGRVETYGEDGLASGRKDDGDAAFEFDTETAGPGAPLPTSRITYLDSDRPPQTDLIP